MPFASLSPWFGLLAAHLFLGRRKEAGRDKRNSPTSVIPDGNQFSGCTKSAKRTTLGEIDGFRGLFCLKSRAGGYAMNTARLSCPSPPFQENARSCSPGTVSDLAAGPGMAPQAAGRAPDVFSPPDPRRSSEVVATACWLRAPLPAVSRQPVGSAARRCRSPPAGTLGCACLSRFSSAGRNLVVLRGRTAAPCARNFPPQPTTQFSLGHRARTKTSDQTCIF